MARNSEKNLSSLNKLLLAKKAEEGATLICLCAFWCHHRSSEREETKFGISIVDEVCIWSTFSVNYYHRGRGKEMDTRNQKRDTILCSSSVRRQKLQRVQDRRIPRYRHSYYFDHSAFILLKTDMCTSKWFYKSLFVFQNFSIDTRLIHSERLEGLKKEWRRWVKRCLELDPHTVGIPGEPHSYISKKKLQMIVSLYILYNLYMSI